jgi:coenzyme F420-reducing hydrogenase alpha subunit
MKNKKTIKVDYLARVEGEGGFKVRFKGRDAAEVAFNIFEPPRFFEAFLRGRDYAEAPDITARICGICPMAYMISALQAMETGFGVELDEQIIALRRLMYCGEWIESHALHIYLLHAPDFFGCQDVLQLASKDSEIVKTGLQLKKIGNEIITFLGGREIHPINLRVGGFYSVPDKKDLLVMKERLEWGRDAALKTVQWTSGFDFPPFEQDYEFVALHHDRAYAIMEGRLVSNKGLDIPISAFEAHVQEEQVAHSTSLHARIKGRGTYMVGPVARFNLNFEQLSPLAKGAAREAGLTVPCPNPFKSIIVRAVETVYAFEEALRILDAYEKPNSPHCEVIPKTMTGFGCTEAPRGICWHRYRVDEHGVIRDARIVPPTSQNQRSIEKDLRRLADENQNLADDALKWRCEQMIRNYDPCISCSCHTLTMDKRKGDLGTSPQME